MNEKEKKSLIIISSVFIFILVFMVFFTFYRRDAMLSDRTIPKINTEIDPPSHGDCNSSCSSSCKYASPGTSQYTYCYTQCMSSCSNPTPQATTPKPTTPQPAITPKPATPAPVRYHTCCYRGTTYDNIIETISCYSLGIGAIEGACPAPAVTAAPPTAEPPSNVDCCYYSGGLYKYAYTTQTSCIDAYGGSVGVSESACNAKNATPVPAATAAPVVCSSQTSERGCSSQQYDTSCKWCSYEGKCKSISDTCATAPTPTPTPVAKKTCFKYENGTCSSVTINGTTCDASSNYYSTWYDCRNKITCGGNEYKYGDNCMSCPSGKNLAYSGCQGSVSMCCVDSTSITKNCYRLLNGVCSEVTIGGSDCGISGNYYNTKAACESSAQSSGSTSTSTASKCCCNFATGHCAMASSCTGSLPSEQSKINRVESCNALDAGNGAACFKDANGKYKWGAYGDNASYTYSVALDKNDCESKVSGSESSTTCTLRCPATVITVGESIMCTFESSDGSSLSTGTGSSTEGRYVKVTGTSVGSISVTGSSSTCTSNAVSINVVEGNHQSNECSVKSVSIAQNLVSVNSDAYSHNSVYGATAKIEGAGCTGKTAVATVTNGTPSPSSVSLPSISNSISYTVTPSSSCSTSTITVCVGSSCASASISTSTDWHPDTIDSSGEGKSCWNPSGSYYNTFYQADLNSASTYYSNYDADKDCFLIKWTRGCGGGSYSPPGSTPDEPTPVPNEPTPNPTPYCYANAKDLINATAVTWATSGSSAYPYLISGVSKDDCKAYACFVNNNKSDYKWANTTPSGYTKVPDILSKNECKPEEDACYIDKNGNYDWGKHKNDSNYTYVTSITDSTKCKKIEGAACYSNGDDYVWTVTPPGGDYHKVPEMDTSVKCKKEKYGCFFYDKKYVWGDYFNKNGYVFVAGITEQEYCNNVGCYVNKNDEYVWGDYSKDSDYTFVTNITDKSKCGYTPDVPKTSMNTQVIVYIATAIMSVAGIYFVVRYNNKGKNY